MTTMRIRTAVAGAFAAVALGLAAALPAQAAEIRIGKAFEKNGMEIGAVYLQSVVMAPMLPGMKAQTDVHIEADIHAMQGNKNGFGPGDWIPYLGITYRIAKAGSTWTNFGPFMPMVASDGPHYGANVSLDGPGKYTLTYHILPPPYQGFFHHTDKETGVGDWWTPFDVEWTFIYAGTGKKGAY